MINGITFQEQLITSSNMAHFMWTFLNKTNGVTKGCAVSAEDFNVYVQAGYFIVFGRMVQIIGTETIAAPEVEAGTLYCKMVFEIDLTKENTSEQFNQGYFKVLSSVEGYPDVEQEDLDAGGTLYQLPFCQFTVSVAGISDFVDLRAIVNIDTIWNVIAEQNEDYRAIFEEYYAGEQAEVYEKFLEFCDDIDTYKQTAENSFNAWFASIRDILDEETATHLLVMIRNLQIAFAGRTTTFNADGSITETTSDYTKVTTFNADGSITEQVTWTAGGTIQTKTTVFNSDGSITETI